MADTSVADTGGDGAADASGDITPDASGDITPDASGDVTPDVTTDVTTDVTNDATDDGAPAAPATALEACQQLNEAEAQLHARCLGGAVADWRMVAAGSMECTRYARHVAEGSVEYRPEGWAACLAKYNLPCQFANPYPCYFEILHGKIPDGQHCEDTDVCGTVSACINISAATCGEVCIRLGNENENCGFYCGATTPCLDYPFCASGLTCVEHVCVKAKGAGDACGGPEQMQCLFGLGCDVDPADTEGFGTCVVLTAGRACLSDGGCLATEFCLGGTCTLRRGAGQTCADAPTACGGAGTCVRAGHVGEACANWWPGGQSVGCVNAFCDGTNCQPIATANQSCIGTSCAVGTSCDSSTNTCRACGP
jgi:hypothetical protein